MRTIRLFPNSECLADIDYSLRKSLFAGPDAGELFAAVMEKAEEKCIYSITDHFSIHMTEKRCAAENELLNAVMRGDPVVASQNFERFLSFQIAPRYKDPVRDSKNLLIVLNTLLCKAATLTSYVNSRRIAAAPKLLSTTDIQIQDIACYVGVEDVNYFTRIFKKRLGVSPTEYKKSFRPA